MQPDWRKVEQEIPSLSVRTARLIGEGWNARAYLVNDELVFRCPKRAEHWEELEREIALLSFAANQLPLAVPRYLQAAPHSPAALNGYAIYRHLRGVAMEPGQLTRSERDAAAAAIADFLRALHALQPSPESGVLLPRENERLNAEEWFARAKSEVAPGLPPRAARALSRVFEMHLGDPANFVFTPVLLHADLSRDHILMEEGEVTGVIDFGDANWGDPDYEFMYLFVDFGIDFAEDIARRYGHVDLVRLRTKLRYFGTVDQIDTILNWPGRASKAQETAARLQLEQLLEGV